MNRKKTHIYLYALVSIIVSIDLMAGGAGPARAASVGGDYGCRSLKEQAASQVADQIAHEIQKGLARKPFKLSKALVPLKERMRSLSGDSKQEVACQLAKKNTLFYKQTELPGVTHPFFMKKGALLVAGEIISLEDESIKWYIWRVDNEYRIDEEHPSILFNTMTPICDEDGRVIAAKFINSPGIGIWQLSEDGNIEDVNSPVVISKGESDPVFNGIKNTLVAANISTGVGVWRYERGRVEEIDNPVVLNKVKNPVFNEQGTLLIARKVVGDNLISVLCVWHIGEEGRIENIDNPIIIARADSSVFNKQGTLLAAFIYGGSSGVRIWQIRDGNIKNVDHPVILRDVSFPKFNELGTLIAAGRMKRDPVSRKSNYAICVWRIGKEFDIVDVDHPIILPRVLMPNFNIDSTLLVGSNFISGEGVRIWSIKDGGIEDAYHSIAVEGGIDCGFGGPLLAIKEGDEDKHIVHIYSFVPRSLSHAIALYINKQVPNTKVTEFRVRSILGDYQL